MAKRTFHGLVIRKLADKSSGVREARFNPETGERYLYDPSTPGFDAEPWPLAGVQLEGDAPKYARVPMSTIAHGKAEGWIALDGEQIVHRPGGPPEEPWRVTHTFVQADKVTLQLVDGDVVYRVLGSPDKWPESKDGELGFGGEVRWYFDLELVS